MGKRYLQDVLETMGAYVDALKFAGGSFSLMPAHAVKELIDLCHQYDVLVSTGGFIEYVLAQGAEAVERYIQTLSSQLTLTPEDLPIEVREFRAQASP